MKGWVVFVVLFAGFFFCVFWGCATTPIKGNISADGEKIYHTADCSAYKLVVVEPSKGEHYFLTEIDARIAGFRKAHNCFPK